MGYSTHAVRIVLGTWSIRSTLYKLKLQFYRISRRSQTSPSRDKRNGGYSGVPTAPFFSAHPLHLQRISARGRRKRPKKPLPPSSSLQKERRATKVERARVKSRRFSLGGMRADLRGGCVPETVDRSKLYTITNPTRNYHVTSLAHCASGNVKD